jgi:hypothetical protein
MKKAHSLIWSLMTFILATFLFVKGYRDIDFAYNLKVIEHYTGWEFCDAGAFIDSQACKDELYLLGLREVLISYVLFIVSLSVALFPYLKENDI